MTTDPTDCDIRMIDAMAPHAYGQAMAGAGGGGFMYVIAKVIALLAAPLTWFPGAQRNGYDGGQCQTSSW